MPTRKRKLLDVKKEEPEESQTYTCEVCGQIFQRGCGLASHMRTHASTEVTCMKCNFTCQGKKAYVKHMQAKHGAKPILRGGSNGSGDMPVLEAEEEEFEDPQVLLPVRISDRRRTMTPPPILCEQVPYTCPKCHEHYPTKTRMTYHLINHRTRYWMISKKSKVDFRQIGHEKNYGFKTGSKLVVKWRLNCEARPISLRRAQLWSFMEENFGCPLDKTVGTPENSSVQRNNQPGTSSMVTRRSAAAPAPAPVVKENAPTCSRSAVMKKKIRMKGGIAFGQMLSLENKKFYMCRGCPYVSWNVSSLWRHARHHIHSSKHSYTCVACSYSSIYLENIKHHVKVHKAVTDINREYNEWLLYERKMNKPDFSGALGDEIDTVAIPMKRFPATSKVVITSRKARGRSCLRMSPSSPPPLFHKNQILNDDDTVCRDVHPPEQFPPVLLPMQSIPTPPAAVPPTLVSTRPVRIITTTQRAVESAQQGNIDSIKFVRIPAAALKSGELSAQPFAFGKSNRTVTFPPLLKAGPPPLKMARPSQPAPKEVAPAVTKSTTEIRWPPLLEKLSKQQDFDEESGTFTTVLKARASDPISAFPTAAKNSKAGKMAPKSKDSRATPSASVAPPAPPQFRFCKNVTTPPAATPETVPRARPQEFEFTRPVSHKPKDSDPVSTTPKLTKADQSTLENDTQPKPQKSGDTPSASAAPKLETASQPSSSLQKLKNPQSATTTSKPETTQSSSEKPREPCNISATPVDAKLKNPIAGGSQATVPTEKTRSTPAKPIETAKLASKIVKEAAATQVTLALPAQSLEKPAGETRVAPSTGKISSIPPHTTTVVNKTVSEESSAIEPVTIQPKAVTTEARVAIPKAVVMSPKDSKVAQSTSSATQPKIATPEKISFTQPAGAVKPAEQPTSDSALTTKSTGGAQPSVVKDNNAMPSASQPSSNPVKPPQSAAAVSKPSNATSSSVPIIKRVDYVPTSSNKESGSAAKVKSTANAIRQHNHTEVEQTVVKKSAGTAAEAGKKADKERLSRNQTASSSSASSKPGCSSGQSSSTHRSASRTAPTTSKKGFPVKPLENPRVTELKAEASPPPETKRRRSQRGIDARLRAAEKAAPPFKEPDVPFDELYPAFTYKGSLKYQEDLQRQREKEDPSLKKKEEGPLRNEEQIARVNKYLKENPSGNAPNAQVLFFEMMAVKHGIQYPKYRRQQLEAPQPPPPQPEQIPGPSRKKSKVGKRGQAVPVEPEVPAAPIVPAQPAAPIDWEDDCDEETAEEFRNLCLASAIQDEDFHAGVRRLRARQERQRRERMLAAEAASVQQESQEGETSEAQDAPKEDAPKPDPPRYRSHEKIHQYFEVELQVLQSGRCCDCHFKSRNHFKMNVHRDHHHLNGLFKCADCSFQANSQNVLTHHLFNDHFNPDVRVYNNQDSSDSEDEAPPPEPIQDYLPEHKKRRRRNNRW